MTILIANRNQQVVNDLASKLGRLPFKFTESTKNTCTFQVGPMGFQRLYKEAKDNGYNPYALMTW